MLWLALLLLHVFGTKGAPGCIDLKREFPNLAIGRRPTKTSDGVCPISRTCCTRQVEESLNGKSEQKLRDVLAREANKVRSSLSSIKEITAKQMRQIMTDLVPGDIAAMVDVPSIADMVWQYTIGEISAYNLTVEVAVIGSHMMFTERANQDLIDMTECIIRELGTHATNAFTQISDIAKKILEPPRTFGYGFEVVEVLLDAIANSEFPEDCSFGKLFTCTQCGLKLPAPCQSTCLVSAKSCLATASDLTASWEIWVNSITKLVDALTLMKEIQIDPNDLVSPDLVQELTNDIMSSMLNVNFRKCRKLEKRGAQSFNSSMVRNKRSGMTEGDVLKSILEIYFDSDDLESGACQSASSSDNACWLGDHVGDFEGTSVEGAQHQQATRSRNGRADKAVITVSNYAETVDSVVSQIYAKVRDQRSRASIPDEYTMFSSSKGQLINYKLFFTTLLIIFVRNVSYI